MTSSLKIGKTPCMIVITQHKKIKSLKPLKYRHYQDIMTILR